MVKRDQLRDSLITCGMVTEDNARDCLGGSSDGWFGGTI